MIWSLVCLVILLVGFLGVTLVIRGLNGWRVEGFRAAWVLDVVGGALLSTPLAGLLWLIVYFHTHPFSLG